MLSSVVGSSLPDREAFDGDAIVSKCYLQVVGPWADLIEGEVANVINLGRLRLACILHQGDGAPGNRVGIVAISPDQADEARPPSPHRRTHIEGNRHVAG